MFHVEHFWTTGQGISIYLPVGMYGSQPIFVLRLPQAQAVSPLIPFIPCLSTMDTIWTYDHKSTNLSRLNVQLSTMSQTLSSYAWTGVQFTARDRRDMWDSRGAERRSVKLFLSLSCPRKYPICPLCPGQMSAILTPNYPI